MTSWYDVIDVAPSALPLACDSESLSPSQRGRFACTRERDHFTLIFDNGDMMWMQPGTAALFEGVCQGEEEDAVMKTL